MTLQILSGASLLIAALVGGGGIGALLQRRRQGRKLDADALAVEVSARAAEVASEDAHWQALLKTQAEELLEPLRSEVGALRAEVERLRQETSSLRVEVETHRGRYIRALSYIRVLLAWARHPQTADIPQPPAELAVDI